jgi:hypothetical protein
MVQLFSGEHVFLHSSAHRNINQSVYEEGAYLDETDQCLKDLFSPIGKQRSDLTVSERTNSLRS